MLPAITDVAAFYDWSVAPPPCPVPRVAAIAGAYDQPRELRRALLALRTEGLPFGYPIVGPAVPMGLALPETKIAIVVALFASTADAKQWSRAHPEFSHVRVRLRNDRVGTWVAVKLDAAGEVPAWDRAQALQFAFHALKQEAVHRDTGEPVRPRPLRRRPRPPVCSIPRDQLFVLTRERVERLQAVDDDRLDNQLDYLPVRCAGRIGYVDPRSTSFRSMFWIDHRGEHHVTQITEGHCGYTTYATSVVPASGQRSQTVERTIEHDGC